MTHTNICKSKEADYFVIASALENPDVSEGNIPSYLLFKKNETLIGMIENVPFNGKWSEDTITIFMGEDEMPIPYAIENDTLKLLVGESPDDAELFRRNNEEIPILDLPDGDATIEVEVTDGANTGRMSVYCPKGWYYYEHLSGKGIIKLSSTPDTRITGTVVTITYSSFQDAKFTIPGKESGYSFDLEGQTYGRSDRDNYIEELITFIGDSAITAKGPHGGPYTCVFWNEIMPSIKLTWNNRQTGLPLCHEKEEDIFKARYVKTTGSDELTLEQLQQCDYQLRFCKDGTVTLKLDKSITSALEENFGDTLTGTYENEIISIPKSDKTGFYPFHTCAFGLNGDILDTVIGSTQIYFHRCN